MINAGQLLAAIQGVEQIGLDTGWATQLDLTNLPADAIVGEDILAVVAIFWPPAAILGELLAVAVAVAPIVIAAGLHVAPAQLPMTEAQTTRSRGGRNG